MANRTPENGEKYRQLKNRMWAWAQVGVVCIVLPSVGFLYSLMCAKLDTHEFTEYKVNREKLVSSEFQKVTASQQVLQDSQTEMKGMLRRAYDGHIESKAQLELIRKLLERIEKKVDGP